MGAAERGARETVERFRRRIEYSICQQFASEEDVRAFCRRAREAGVGVCCFNPVNVKLGAQLLAGSGIEVSTNVGFPFGSHPTAVKVLETEIGVADGATQVDMVIHVGALRTGRDEIVADDIRAVVRAAGGRPVKTIIETWVLSGDELERACRIAEQAGAALVKTTTGVRTQYLLAMREEPRGAVAAEIRRMRAALSPRVRIKASGGIETLDDALEMIRAGADQLGMSRGEEIVREFRRRYPDGLEL